MYSASVFSPSSWAQDAYTLQGYVGGAVYRTPAMTRTADSAKALLPYAYADYGPFYARINTLGYKAMPLGVGHMEISARVTLEGDKSAKAGVSFYPQLGWERRSAKYLQHLYGISTYQAKHQQRPILV